MTSTSVTRRAPFWILLGGSVALTAYGVWATTSRIAAMEVALAANTATGAQVYGGQAWVVLEAGLVVGGVIGLAAALAVWALDSRSPRRIDASPLAPSAEPHEAEVGTADETLPTAQVTEPASLEDPSVTSDVDETDSAPRAVGARSE